MVRSRPPRHASPEGLAHCGIRKIACWQLLYGVQPLTKPLKGRHPTLAPCDGVSLISFTMQEEELRRHEPFCQHWSTSSPPLARFHWLVLFPLTCSHLSLLLFCHHHHHHLYFLHLYLSFRGSDFIFNVSIFPHNYGSVIYKYIRNTESQTLPFWLLMTSNAY